MPSSLVRSFIDPHEHQQFIRGGEIEVIVTGSGTFRSSLTRVDLHKLWLQRCDEALPRIQHTSLLKGRTGIFFLADEKQGSIHHSAMGLGPDHLVFYSPESEHYSHSTSQCHWASMTLAPEQMAEAGHTLTGSDLMAHTQNRLVRPPAHLMARLRGLHDVVGQLAAAAPDVLAKDEVARALEEELVHVMVKCLTDDTSADTHRARSTRLPVMLRLERIVKENRGKPLYVTDVCATIGVTERTLRHHCMEHLGISPHRYLWLRRMHQARRALATADVPQTTVTNVATEHGFWELGRFSVAYRKLFGESPSATLRRGA